MALKQDIQERFDSLEAILEEYASEFARIYKERLREDNFKATGKLIDSITTKVKKGSDYYIVTFNAKDYWKYVEESRNSGKWPPAEAIAKWIKAKQILPQPDKDGNLPTEAQLVYLIRRAIGQKGTIKRYNYDGSHIVAETVEQLNEQYMPLLEEALQQDMEHYIAETFEDAFSRIKIW